MKRATLIALTFVVLLSMFLSACQAGGGKANIRSKDDLSGKKVGVQIATTGAMEAEKISGAIVKTYDTIDLAFLDLMNGQIDAVIADYPTSLAFIGKNPDKLTTVGEVFTDEDYGIAVCKDRKDLLDRINAGLKKAKEDGVIAALDKKWLQGNGTGETYTLPETGSMTVRVATDATYPPFETVDENTKQLVGYDIDLMAVIAKNADLKVEFVNLNFDPLLAGLAQCQYDAAISAITITEERSKSMLFSDSYVKAGQIVTVRK